MFTLDQTGYSCKWVNDSQRFLLEWFDAINNCPSQVYHLALPFCPPSSWLYKCYAVELSKEVKVVKGLPVEWGMCSRTVTLNYTPLAVTCWKDTIAVSLESGDIVVLDGNTGSQIAILSEHTGRLRSLAFSPDGTSLASGSDDKTIKLWDVQTGGAIKIFHGHTDWVLSVSVSADCTMIASGSSDMTIRLWNIQTEECQLIIKQHDSVFRVWFSPTNSQHFISASGGKVQQWDISGHQINPVHNGSYIAFSLDGTQFVLIHGETIEVRNSESGAIVVRFQMASGLHHCCFSPNGRLIAAAANSTAYIWDITSSDPHPIKAFIGHTELITSLVFSSSPSLISSSLGHSVKFWQIGDLSTDTAVPDPESTPLTSAPIKSITLQAKDGVVISRDSDGVVRTWEISTGLCKASFQTPAKNYCLGDVRLVNTRLISAWEEGMKIHIWDVEKGELQTVDSTQGIIYDVKISGDGSKVFGLYSETIQAWSILTGEVVGKVQREVSQHRKFLAVDGSRVWVNSPLSEPLGWDFGIPSSSPTPLSNTPLYLPTDTKLWDISQSRIKDTVSGKVFFQLAGRFAEPTGSQWDGCYLVAGYDSGEVLILDFSHIFL